MKKQCKWVAVIKNGHTKAQMRAMEKRFVAHQGPYLTLAEVIAIEQAKQQGERGDKGTSPAQP